MQIGNVYLKAKRQEAGMSLRALGERAGVSYVHIKHIEDGAQDPTLGVFVRILHALDISMYTFLKDMDYKKCRWGESNPHEVALNGF